MTSYSGISTLYAFCLVETQDQLITKEKSTTANKQKRKRKAPCCTKCGEPMRGHLKSVCQLNLASQQNV